MDIAVVVVVVEQFTSGIVEVEKIGIDTSGIMVDVAKTGIGVGTVTLMRPVRGAEMGIGVTVSMAARTGPKRTMNISRRATWTYACGIRTDDAAPV